MSLQEMAESSHSAVAIGCSVAVVSSAVQSFGITLQRKSHLLSIDRLHKQSQNQTHLSSAHNGTRSGANEGSNELLLYQHQHIQTRKRNMWYFGFTLFIIANVLGSVVQISTLPLIILSPLQSIGLIFNSIFSCLLLKEDHFTTKLWIGTAIIAVGAFTIAMNGSSGNGGGSGAGHLNPSIPISERFEKILHRLFFSSFSVWFFGTFVAMFALFFINYIYLNRKLQEANQHRQRYAIKNGKRDILLVKFNKYQFWKGINYGIISGTLTAHTFLFAKSIIDVIIESIISRESKEIFSQPTPYLLLVAMLMIVGLQLTSFNLGLAHVTTAVLYPLCFLVYNLINLINDVAYNRLLVDHKMSKIQFAWILVGLLAVLVGVLILSLDASFQGAKCQHRDNDERFFEDYPDNNKLSTLDTAGNTQDLLAKANRYSEQTALLKTFVSTDSSNSTENNILLQQTPVDLLDSGEQNQLISLGEIEDEEEREEFADGDVNRDANGAAEVDDHDGDVHRESLETYTSLLSSHDGLFKRKRLLTYEQDQLMKLLGI